MGRNAARLNWLSELALTPTRLWITAFKNIPTANGQGSSTNIDTCTLWWFPALRMGNIMRFLIHHIFFSFSITSSWLKVLILAVWLLNYVNFLHWTHRWNSTIIKAQSTSGVECAAESFWIWNVIKLVISSLQSANLRAATGRHRSLSLWCSCIVLTGHCCSCCWCCRLPRDCIHGPSSHRHGDGPRGGNPWWEGALRCHHICSVCCGGGKWWFTKGNNGSNGGVLAVMIVVMSVKMLMLLMGGGGVYHYQSQWNVLPSQYTAFYFSNTF